MISVLAQERLLGFALGTAVTGIIVFEQRKCIYKSILDNQSEVASKSLTREPIFAKETRSDFAHLWNKAVDQTFGPLIESIGSRRW
ncbi:Zinc finger, C3HC4 type family protein [Melia azedarach]|uniref:Zinc finger, C3HC4 type family protein n=1 Tax=Melia azedarach TaxID=155640 RepID=A0ACC1YRF8_MELAZ|nr:Zinc finger, C3HC4 type family protein [Melia azedarach]